MPSRVKRPDLGFAIIDELCREGARQIAIKHLASQELWNVEVPKKQLVSDVKKLKGLVDALTASRILENFDYATEAELMNDNNRIQEQIAFLKKKKESADLKSQATKDQQGKGQPGGENVPEIGVRRNTLLKESNESRGRELGIDISENALRERARISMEACQKKWAQASATE